MSGLLDRIGEMLGMKKKPGTSAAGAPADPIPTTAPSSSRVPDENPDAAPTDVEDTEPDDPRNDTTSE
jgi:hypothetical protein